MATHRAIDAAGQSLKRLLTDRMVEDVCAWLDGQ